MVRNKSILNMKMITIFLMINTFPMDRYILKIQSNLVNSKSLGLEALFRNNKLSNYREVDIKLYSPPILNSNSFISIKHMLWVRKRNVSEISFFYAPKRNILCIVLSTIMKKVVPNLSN